MAKYTPLPLLWNHMPSIPQFYTDCSSTDFIVKASEVVLAMHKLCRHKNHACNFPEFVTKAEGSNYFPS